LDSLILFLEVGKLPTVRRTGEIPEEMTEAEALKQGLIRRDTVYSEAYTVLFPTHEKATHLATLKYIPFTGRTKEFTIEAGTVQKNNISVSVLEVSALLREYMLTTHEEERKYGQLVVNAAQRERNMNRFPGRKFGSMTDAQTEGNWE
jgi:hypothetical protein